MLFYLIYCLSYFFCIFLLLTEKMLLLQTVNGCVFLTLYPRSWKWQGLQFALRTTTVDYFANVNPHTYLQGNIFARNLRMHVAKAKCMILRSWFFRHFVLYIQQNDKLKIKIPIKLKPSFSRVMVRVHKNSSWYTQFNIVIMIITVTFTVLCSYIKIISQVMFQWNDKPKATSTLWSGKLYCNILLQKRKLCSNSNNKVSCLGQFRERNFLLSFLLSFFYPSQLTQNLVNSTKKHQRLFSAILDEWSEGKPWAMWNIGVQ